MSVIIAILALNIIIIVHELGHFISAKKMGIKVLEFSLFIGPKIFSVQRGDTTYSLRLIPLMAYVKMEGEEEDSDSRSAFRNKPLTARAITVIGGPLANLLLAVFILTAVFSMSGFATTEIGYVEENSPAAAAGIRKGDRIISYDGKRTYLPIDVIQFIYVSKGAPAKIEYERDGERFSEIIEPIIHPATVSPKIGVALGGQGETGSTVISGLSPGMPAEKMGLKVGDRIKALNGVEVNTAEELIAFVNQNGFKPLEVKVLRDGAEINVTITPVEVKTDEWYDAGMLFMPRKGGFFESLAQAATYTFSVVRSTGYSLVWLVTGKASVSELIGPIGMVSTISAAVRHAPSIYDMLLELLNTTALFSIALGATNLIPFPVLDGGRLVLILVEAVRGKPLSQEKEAYISMVGFAVIILLGLFVAYNDIIRLVTG
ncbi:MAG: RIP metalloprotease RseP [Bacillota bacterium]